MTFLPRNKQMKTLRELRPGQKTWTVPWAMYLDRHGKLWLNSEYAQNKGSGGTAQMLVMRDKQTGAYHVDASGVDHQWGKGRTYFGKFTPIEVAHAKFSA